MRIRLTTSRPAGYRRGGLIIGDRAAPTVIAKEDVEPSQMLAILSDPNIAIDVSEDDDGDQFTKIDDDDRQAGIEGLTAAIEAESAKVDPSDPPTGDAADAQSGGELQDDPSDPPTGDVVAAQSDSAPQDAPAAAAEVKKPEGAKKPRVAQPKG